MIDDPIKVGDKFRDEIGDIWTVTLVFSFHCFLIMNQNRFSVVSAQELDNPDSWLRLCDGDLHPANELVSLRLQVRDLLEEKDTLNKTLATREAEVAGLKGQLLKVSEYNKRNRTLAISRANTIGYWVDKVDNLKQQLADEGEANNLLVEAKARIADLERQVEHWRSQNVETDIFDAASRRNKELERQLAEITANHATTVAALAGANERAAELAKQLDEAQKKNVWLTKNLNDAINNVLQEKITTETAKSSATTFAKRLSDAEERLGQAEAIVREYRGQSHWASGYNDALNEIIHKAATMRQP